MLLDFDDSVNLTHRYGQYPVMANNVINLFEKGEVSPIKISDNLDLIAGHKDVALLKQRLNERRRREYIFGNWLANHEAELIASYDYVIVDTENDEDILTLNALLVSDIVVGVGEPSKDSFLALLSLQHFVKVLNEEFKATAQLVMVGNKINLSENNSKELLEDLSNYPEYIGYMPERTALANETSVFSNDSHNKLVRKQLTNLFDKLCDVARNQEVL
ncbi:ParA [Leuconostoc inhae]|uniref:ParA n=1 Tax=Leuconostoc inhae TaxID=178001 RepID=A0AAN2QUN9_9LACO|nr:hypothetical protein KSL4_0038 [Leuconostoc inhae]CUW07948.1 ParA [Leuconostoc inhae]